MRPFENERTLLVYRGPAPGIGDLKCERVRPGLIRSFWMPSPLEISILMAGGVVELTILGEPISPVAVNALSVADSNAEYIE